MAVLVEDRGGADSSQQIADQRDNSILQWQESRDLLAVASVCDAKGGEVNFFTKKTGPLSVFINCNVIISSQRSYEFILRWAWEYSEVLFQLGTKCATFKLLYVP
ncbi:hypothetical protein L596_001772 [Steinernema carpocapsae]|uniref:Uncharacterized protein n=1 Tax=Steinernema carpocapsae TaxID=34508 RepID=A0A4U8UMH6_STECR|nr:hypothetical protein L596_001772 [Steinernema carpocapsae]